MRIGLFVDVDKTLTVEVIQAEFAKHLGCLNEFKPIEDRFQKEEINSSEFGSQLVKLFASKGFKEETARGLFEQIELRGNSKDLLKGGENVDVYLVSSGPSYYVEKLAETYRIPTERVLCSKYTFDGRNGPIESCEAISLMDKRNFVQKYAPKYDISIGVGDSQEFDGPFISECTIHILVEAKESFLHVTSFSALKNMITNLKNANLARDRASDNGMIDLAQLATLQKLSRLTLRSWSLIAFLFVVAVVLGAYLAPNIHPSFGDLFKFLLS